MNSWSAVGAIFLLIGFILLIVGLVQGVNAMNAINPLGQILGEYGNQLKGTLFWNSAQSYLVGSLVCFAIGGVGYYAGRATQTVAGEMAPLSRPIPKVASSSQIQCGSCGTMNDIDAVFCKKCGNAFR